MDLAEKPVFYGQSVKLEIPLLIDVIVLSTKLHTLFLRKYVIAFNSQELIQGVPELARHRKLGPKNAVT